MNQREISHLALLVLFGVSVIGQAAHGQARVTYSGNMSVWTPVHEVFAADGTLRAEYAVPTNYLSGNPVVCGRPETVGDKIRWWMDAFANRYGSAEELGFKDGDDVDTRRFCLNEDALEHLGARLHQS